MKRNCQHLLNHRKSKRIPEKHLLLLYWLHQNLWLCITANYQKFFKRWEYQTTWPASWKTCLQVKKQQLELDIEQQTGFKLGKEYIKAVYSPCLFNLYAEYIMRTARLDKHKLESRLPGEISITSDDTICRWHHPYGRKRGTKESPDESENGEWKSWLKTHHSKNKDHGIHSHHFMANR